ncbi:MAG TPA: hypothetical protein VK151_00035 [Fluviicola sp.]|nr:hypothetical protein [Fluviicola sp.]
MKLLLFFLTAFTLAACSLSRETAYKAPKKAMTCAEYCAWAQSAEYPYRDTQTVNNVHYVLEYLPTELEVAQQLRGKRITTEEAQTWLSEDNADLHFLLTIITPTAGTDLYHFDLGEEESSADRSTYYAFAFKNDIHLVTTKDSIAPGGYLHERGLANYPVAKFSLDFPKSALKESASFTINDKHLTQSAISFSVKDWHTIKIPTLHIQ